jgi:hypothetical protein
MLQVGSKFIAALLAIDFYRLLSGETTPQNFGLVIVSASLGAACAWGIAALFPRWKAYRLRGLH